MIRKACFVLLLSIFGASVQAQPKASSSPSPAERSSQPRPGAQFELAEYGVGLKPDARLIIVMAALDAAGFDPTPPGKEVSAFRALVRKDQANLDPGLRERQS